MGINIGMSGKNEIIYDLGFTAGIEEIIAGNAVNPNRKSESDIGL